MTAAPSLAARVAGVFRSPRHIFVTLAGSPRWTDVLILTTLVVFLSQALLFSTVLGRRALVDQWERTALAFGRGVDDAAYARLQELSGHGVAYAALFALATGPVAALLLTVLLRIVGSALGGAPTWRQLLAVVTHSQVILAVRQIVAAVAAYVTEGMTSPASLVRLAGAIDEGSPLARFLASVDLFTVWWVIVLAVGVAVLLRRSVRPVMLAFTGAYLLVALVLAGVMALAGGATS